MNQSKKKKKIQLYMPGDYDHSCLGEYMPIAEIQDITPESALRREAAKGQDDISK